MNELLPAAVIALRVVASTLAAYNICWSFVGVRAFTRGDGRPPAVYLSVVFWFSVAVLVFQASYLAGQSSQWRLLAYLLLTAAMGLAAIGHRLGASLKAQQFYAMYDHLSPALAIVDLARVDVAAAERIADECRRLTAQVLATRHG